MMGMIQIARQIEGLPTAQRQRFLDLMIKRAFNEEGSVRDVLLDFNAKLFTVLRKEGLWPPKET